MIAAIEELVSGAPHTAYIFAAEMSGEPDPDRREIVEARFFAFEALPGGLSALTHSRLALWREKRAGD